MFLAWVEQGLAPVLRAGELVILDNLATHKVRGVREAIAARGAGLLYLPHYLGFLWEVLIMQHPSSLIAILIGERRRANYAFAGRRDRIILKRAIAVFPAPASRLARESAGKNSWLA